MTGYRDRILTAALAVCMLSPGGADCRAELTDQQQSLIGVKLITVHVSCSELAKEAGLDEQDVRSGIGKQLEEAGISVVRDQVWARLPGRCRFKATVNVQKPPYLDTLMYNLKVEFVQTVALARLPETRIDATTWERTWFGHGSKKWLAEAVPHNLRVLTASFVKDHRLANYGDDQRSDSSGSDDNSAAASGQAEESKVPGAGFIASKGSDVFHKADCRWAQNISTDNLILYRNREEAVMAGKRPCKWCNP